MGATMPTGYKNEVLYMNSGLHLKDVSPTDVEQTSERSMSWKVCMFAII